MGQITKDDIMEYRQGQATEVFKDFLQIWEYKEEGFQARMLNMLWDDFSGFGRHIVYTSPSDFRDYLGREKLQMPDSWEITFHWIKEKCISEQIVVVNAEVAVLAHFKRGDVNFDPIRISAVFKADQDELRIINWHGSVQDTSEEDEVFPGSKEPRRYEDLTILFTDFVGFTNVSSTIPPRMLVRELNELFLIFDQYTKMYSLNKIKTIGDSYMLVGGLKNTDPEHAINCIKWSKEVLNYLVTRNKETAIKWQIRIGIHTGAAVGGTIGQEKLSFDLWGDSVNIASRMEKECEPNRINISAYTFELVRNTFECEYRGKLLAKGKGNIDMYYVL